MDQKNDTQKKKRKITSRQVVAIAGIVLLVLMYLITLVAAIADNSASASLFRICLLGTFVIPLIIWLYTWMYARLTGHPAIGDPASIDSEEIPSQSAGDSTHEDK